MRRPESDRMERFRMKDIRRIPRKVRRERRVFAQTVREERRRKERTRERDEARITERDIWDHRFPEPATRSEFLATRSNGNGHHVSDEEITPPVEALDPARVINLFDAEVDLPFGMRIMSATELEEAERTSIDLPGNFEFAGDLSL
ncbi:hypothetical protein A3G67_01625 [Candidatus Roizmanbacteria bacterium RIFCSPLOWO2_12_FULL_40_12]|uniref:Uncharacterized protein n=1 Tax=Candidatus Roizmanbacteria bacterium RIFCSPLOWO2_01_FULL_40_42 TaxID=1802066 RepID=A0A1F7J304_9BACT|nr:MAG: hypothetical protein A2779_03755 [Candidatus Roizmanbacteria bacterium RIFCSPHIGHO2_01_FULL_40_98]OGK28449.1 MAG: hypothetical protein A3C31_02560 [Candidatus Roizmanbacteria bacterium RIFCSPHIGHO2_02_FULL_40_53]OGK30352.1 MAG: hypothetical protein A2W49_01180 [Candidatus Roizmanbacteria bacterium RIFCSPHIGHO2_12_41_18]OGK36243.1 MAG: hypothetical protein A3E69_04460 [Candidatus Roizmanbacteria bacterium RIFCSPHIGHO2_12_FULL_40_130]OGK49998.1 MAG: hypothetical protein A3B50_03135 [Candi